ncbi:YaaR family protein [Fodinisporobacter ferrooxydans]|uniref:YaaR family protein n=1 Tax=Fodinisporobacter ferrooxydans TaxID=2901836 RepID=A0ABY4CMW6_9BACL|nr:YaaR family protein [Alicyclobacillaceae bacterium MYW30-H2]
MKIGESLRTVVERIGTREDQRLQEGTHSSFRELYSKASSKLQKEELDRLLVSIDEMGQRLKKRFAWNDLKQYKERIQKFLEQVVKNGYSTKEERGFDRRGRMKIYHVVSQIDDLLSELASELIKGEQDQLEILKKIGEIRGLLINLYM